MSKRSRARRFMRSVAARLRRLARPLAARTREGRRLVYEGDIYLRPAGRGVVLLDEHLKPDIDEWLEGWLDFDTGLLLANTAGRVRITVEYLGAAHGNPEDW
jgi:hypothetical protein